MWSFELLLIITSYTTICHSHGRLIEPPSRASAWRYGFHTLADYNDHELFCGGFHRQWQKNEGKCGECGDAWDMKIPRPHEHGGQWGQGVIVRNYYPGTDINIRIELTASHMGFFEFRLCPNPNAKQECLDKTVLKIVGGTPMQSITGDLDTRFYPRNGSRIYEIKAHLPDMDCDHCVLQWRYVAGNNWGICENGVGAVGCGPQEEFRSCSDISINNTTRTSMRPVRPTVPMHTYEVTTKESPKLIEVKQKSYILEWISITILLSCTMLSMGIFYLYKKKQITFKLNLQEIFEHFKENTDDCSNNKNFTIARDSSVQVNLPLDQKDFCSETESSIPPIPPPRTKKHSNVN